MISTVKLRSSCPRSHTKLYISLLVCFKPATLSMVSGKKGTAMNKTSEVMDLSNIIYIIFIITNSNDNKRITTVNIGRLNAFILKIPFLFEKIWCKGILLPNVLRV